MNFKRFLIICIGLVMLQYIGFAQNQMATPYSFVGLGTNYHRGDIRTLSMGNTGMAVRHNMSLNMVNPAGLSGIDSLSFVGSVTKWWKTALYVNPVSQVGYEVFDYGKIDNVGNAKYEYNGNGGISSFTWAHGFNITKQLAIGISGGYNFGKIEHVKMLSFPDSAFLFSSQVQQKLQLRGFSWEIGAQYYAKVSEQNTLGIGVKYGLSSSWKSDEKHTALRFLGDNPFNNTTVDTVAQWRLEPVQIP